MGRRKIEIQPITHERNRSVTFLKRKNGLFKKAYELGVLCSVDVAVIVFEERPGHHLKLYQYGSSDIHEIIQRHLQHDGEKDTRGPADFSGGASGSKMDDGGEGDDDDGDDDGDDGVVSSMRGGPKRRGDGQFKPSTANDLMNADLDYGSSRMSQSHPQHPPRQLPPSVSMSQQQHQHPISSDRLGPMYPHQSNKKPRLGIAPNTGLGHSRSSSDDPIPTSASPVSGGRGSARYPHSADPLSRSFGTASGYLPHHVPSVHHQQHNTSTSHQHHSRHNQQQQHPQYTPFFNSGGQGSYGGQGGGSTPPPPSFIPLQSQADFSTSARGRSASSSGGGVLSSRNVYAPYGVDTGGGGPPPPNSAGGSTSTGGSAGGSAGPNGDLLAAFMDAEQQARVNMARRNSTSSGGQGGAGGGGGGGSSAFRLDWPVHVPPAPPTEGAAVPSKPASHSGSERGDRERDPTSATSGGTVSAGGASGGGGNSAGSGGGNTDWLDFLSGATTNGATAG